MTKDVSRTIRLNLRTATQVNTRLRQAFAAIEKEGVKQMRAEGFPNRAVQIVRGLDMRYEGQSYDLTVPFPGDYVAAFHRAHQQRYGYSDRERACEIVNVRARFIGATLKPDLPKLKTGGSNAKDAIVAKRKLMFSGRDYAATIYDRDKLKAGNRIAGPAIVTEYSATTFVPPGWSGRVDPHGNIVLVPSP